MPRVPLEQLSDDARAWVFASDRAISGPDAVHMLAEVDDFLDQWRAHGVPLTASREWRDDRFLVVAAEGEDASGCSIDGLFRALKALGPQLGAKLVSSGLVFYRDDSGTVQSLTRPQFSNAAGYGAITAETPVFDTSLTRLGDVRTRFERPAGESWQAALLPAPT